MPVKWKIFLVLNFILSIPALICFIFVFVQFINRHLNGRGGDETFVYLFLFSFFAIAANGLLNIYLLQRFFPDKMLSVAVKRLNIVSLTVNVLVSIGLMILCIYAASYEFGNDPEMRDEGGRIALGFIFFFWIVQVVVLVMQGQLPGLISRNNRNKMDSLIDSIGR
jgi:hypothetical protein